ncbi:MAG: dihydrolipoamide acetyltransferase family protein [Gammaproteobacteria bacterium]
MSIFKLPDLGEGLPDAEINQWHVKEGDVVKLDQLLVSMETAKAVVDVPAPQSGKITKLYGKVGDIIKTGAPLIEFEAEETAKPTGDAGTVAGKIEVADVIIQDSAIGIERKSATGGAIKAMPAVRMLAKQLGIALSNVSPTGANGQITSEDVQKAASNIAEETLVSENATIEPLRGVRRAMANAMSLSHAEVAPVTIVDDADIFSWAEGTDITARVLRAIVAGCRAEPALNAHFDMKKLERRLFSEVNIGIAMDSGEGLFVPVLKDVESLSPADIRQHINRFKELVKARTIPQDDLKGSTIQLSNFGTFAGRYANPMLVPPIVAILGTGRIHNEVVAFQGTTAIHKILPLSLTIDHRAVTGGEAARFLAAVIADLQKA